MRKHLLIGLSVAVLGLAGWFYYSHSPKVPAAPKDLTKVLAGKLLEQATPEQLAVLHGDAASAPNASAAARTGAASPQGPALADALTPPDGLKLTLVNDTKGTLKGQAANATAAAIVCAYPAGTLFSNGAGDVVLLRDCSVNVPPQTSVDLALPVAQTSVEIGVLQGHFTPHAGTVEALKPLLTLLASSKKVSPVVAQTAVLIADNDASLDVVASFPRMRPVGLATTGVKPFAAAPSELMEALDLVQEAGIDPAKTGILSEPQLKIMTMLNPDSHLAAKAFFGITDDTEWAFWKKQLTEGDPALRHFALYGIARYYPDVALQMLPRWVRDASLYRNYRLSAAWALALIDDVRAQEELKDLRGEMQGDLGMRQAIDRALKRWENGSARVSGNTAG